MQWIPCDVENTIIWKGIHLNPFAGRVKKWGMNDVWASIYWTSMPEGDGYVFSSVEVIVGHSCRELWRHWVEFPSYCDYYLTLRVWKCLQDQHQYNALGMNFIITYFSCNICNCVGCIMLRILYSSFWFCGLFKDAASGAEYVKCQIFE